MLSSAVSSAHLHTRLMAVIIFIKLGMYSSGSCWCRTQVKATRTSRYGWIMNALLTPQLPQPVNFPGWKVHTYTPANSIFEGPITTLLSILCILIEVLLRAHAKREKSLNNFKFGASIGRISSDGAARFQTGQWKDQTDFAQQSTFHDRV